MTEILKFDEQEYRCTCGQRVNGGYPVGETGRRPSLPPPGTPMICRYCYTIHKWGTDDRLHLSTPEDIAGYQARPSLWRKIQEHIDKLKRKKQSKEN